MLLHPGVMEVALGTTGGVPRGASLSAGGGARMVFIGLVVIRKNFQEHGGPQIEGEIVTSDSQLLNKPTW